MAKSKPSIVTVETPKGPVKWNTGKQWKVRAKTAFTKYGNDPETLNAILAIETVGVVNMVTAKLAALTTINEAPTSAVRAKKAQTRKAAKRAPKGPKKKPVAPQQTTRSVNVTNGTRMRVIENLKLGSGHRITLVEVDNRTILLSTSTKGVTYLTEIGSSMTVN